MTANGYLRTAVALGRYDWVTLVHDCTEYLDGEITEAEAGELAGPHFAAHLSAQTGWPERTDNDRLTDAFRALDRAGIIAREDFACCQNCGVDEIGAEAPADDPARGYVFYHEQDAAGAAEGGNLWLAYGLIGQPPSVEIGREIASAVRAEGLRVDWDESPDQRISVRMRWARRRHGRMAACPSGPGGAEIGVEVVEGEHRLPPRLPDTVLRDVELPWLPAGVSVRLSGGGRSVVVHREFDRLVAADGRSAGRFDGLSLLTGTENPSRSRGPGPLGGVQAASRSPGPGPLGGVQAASRSPGPGPLGGAQAAALSPEPDLLDVTFQAMPTGARQPLGRPMTSAEAIDVLRRLPTRTDSWLSALGRSGGCVQMRWENGRLWLETPDPAVSASVGKHATLAEAERMLTVLATEDRVAISELPEVITLAW
ncbi:hypothetical protein Ait01nite_100210 [Actinoplanes italicus]|uniref:DUF6891 domain-containing protein n=1 Tax=Actinoplanes italicus TaxID=113567 RepID=A0A2T0JCG4_9ACTN|nr:hypothetical protein [Actinoplanes italicus]PRX05112.1 hypothetical protein CLV67_14625 [Actinoplanes italicus]GIE36976.1 hypothetical protein Ait01nite_100210 [Actinoplanes italicus]